jgi:hypothetical protein
MRATNSSLVFTFSLYTSLFIHPHRQKSDLYAPTSNSCIFTPVENWTHVYINLFTQNSPYCHLLKYLLFLLKHPVQCLYSCVCEGVEQTECRNFPNSIPHYWVCVVPNA